MNGRGFVTIEGERYEDLPSAIEAVRTAWHAYKAENIASADADAAAAREAALPHISEQA